MSTANSNIHFTLVGSGFHDSFVDALKSKQQYTYGLVSAFTEYKAAPDGHDAEVIVLNGHDEELAKTTTLAMLLDKPIILVFFAPSKEILANLHKAAKSLISIPSVELDAGVPLIIHRRPHDGVISLNAGSNIMMESLTPNTFSHGDEMSDEDAKPTPTIPAPAPTILTLEEKLSMTFAKSVDVIQLTVEYLLELLHNDSELLPRNEDYLTPPAGTLYYKTTELSLISVYHAGQPHFVVTVPATNQSFNQSPRLQLHAYCAEAKPDEQFSQNGGVVYVVGVLRGHSGTGDDPRQLWPNANQPQSMNWFLDFTSYNVHAHGFTGLTAQPQIERTVGLDSTYDINFSRRFNMWSNGGDTLSEIALRYTDSFTRNQFKQKVQSNSQEEYSTPIYYDNYYDKSVGDVPAEGDKGWYNVFDSTKVKPFPPDHIPLHALFAWRTSSLTLATIITQSLLSWAGYQTIIPIPQFRSKSTALAQATIHYNLDLTPGNW